jgi:hypothetical protein
MHRQRYQKYYVTFDRNEPKSSDVFWISASNMDSPSFSTTVQPTLATQASSGSLYGNITAVYGPSGYELPAFYIELLDDYEAQIPASNSTIATITAVDPSDALVFGTTEVAVSAGNQTRSSATLMYT